MASDLGVNESFADLLKKVMKDRNLSMRKLAQLSGIDSATISRIINGKRKANLNHLEKLSGSLQIPLSTLLVAAGYRVENKEGEQLASNQDLSMDYIRLALESSSQVTGEPFTMDTVNQLLIKFQEESDTAIGRKTILNRFKEKVTKLSGVGPHIHQLEKMYEMFRLRKGETKQLLLIGGALLYFICTIDAVPDYLFPFGFLDDVLVVQYVTNSLSLKQ